MKKKQNRQMCWGDFCHSCRCFMSLIGNAQHLNILLLFFFWRSGQDHLCPLETYCVPVEPNNEETNFLFCRSYVNHVISKSSQNILEEERKGVFHFKETLEFHSFYCLWLSSILNENLPDLLTYYTSACYSLLQLCDFLCNGHKEIALASFHPL